MRTSLVLLLLTISVFSKDTSVPPYTLLGSISVTKPAFANLGTYGPKENPGPVELIVTSFSGIPIFGTDYIFLFPDVASNLSNWNQTTPVQLTTKVTWPNEATTVPYEYFNRAVLAVGGGFLVPGESTGAVSLFLMDTNPPTGPIQISTDYSGYFYHQVTWRDINGDGLQDVLTARATKPIFGNGNGQLVWIEQPKSDPFNSPWTEQVLVAGPEFFFVLLDIDGDGNEELIATEYFGASVTLFWNWKDPNTVQSRVIDSTIGATFDLTVVDVNNDGKVDLLVTNHVDNATLSGVYVYEIPTNYKTGNWIRHDLATGFVTRVSGISQASPGKGIAVFPHVSDEGKTKPVILLGGDGSMYAYLITPNSQDPNNWSYNVTTVLEGGGTVGQVVAGDVNGDGWSEFFIPMYDDELLWAYTFAPEGKF